MTETDYGKKEEKDKKSADAQLLGFKKLPFDGCIEEYQVGDVSPSQERVSTRLQSLNPLILCLQWIRVKITPLLSKIHLSLPR